MAKKRTAKSAQGKSTATMAEVLKLPGSALTLDPFEMLPKDDGRDKYFENSARGLVEVMAAKPKPKFKKTPIKAYIKLPADQAKKVKQVSAKLTRKVMKELAAQEVDGPVRIAIRLDELTALLPKPKPRKKPPKPR